MDNMQALEQSAAASAQVSGVASKATIIGGTGTSAYTLLGGDMTLSIIGIICTIGTFLVNWYFKRKEHKLNERKLELEYEMRMLAEQRRQMETDARIAALHSGHIPPVFANSTKPGAL